MCFEGILPDTQNQTRRYHNQSPATKHRPKEDHKIRTNNCNGKVDDEENRTRKIKNKKIGHLVSG